MDVQMPSCYRFQDLTVDEKAEKLDENKWLAPLDHLRIEQLSKYVDVYVVDEEQRIFKMGDRTPYFCLILSGHVRIVKEDDRFEEQLIAHIHGGHTIGEMSLLDGEPRSATGITSSATELAVLTKVGFEQIQRAHPDLHIVLLNQLVKTVSQRLRQSSGMLVDAVCGGDVEVSDVDDDVTEVNVLPDAEQNHLKLVLEPELMVQLKALSSLKRMTAETFMIELLKKRVHGPVRPTR